MNPCCDRDHAGDGRCAIHKPAKIVSRTAIIVDDNGNAWCGPFWRWQPLALPEARPGGFRPVRLREAPVVVYDSPEKAERQAERLRRRYSGLTLSRALERGARLVAVAT